ncbi:hypothetical protein BESB_023450 [Besnoitia besnoiti]|uniref:Uncharacterized protein n=1 Tax=Besnoitia besnoiti TaxID=94643 RepID=A0A2A9M846_BESBE|nr:hypothetical protein BESB_023450 [Besnoitia besnoiti]PFH31853.1 hypothetical protein BESB_023450 [Besnoitia besnoiti]
MTRPPVAPLNPRVDAVSTAFLPSVFFPAEEAGELHFESVSNSLRQRPVSSRPLSCVGRRAGSSHVIKPASTGGRDEQPSRVARQKRKADETPKKGGAFSEDFTREAMELYKGGGSSIDAAHAELRNGEEALAKARTRLVGSRAQNCAKRKLDLRKTLSPTVAQHDKTAFTAQNRTRLSCLSGEAGLRY